jgi:glycosyltransferase involved in cell wall biosynthesis
MVATNPRTSGPIAKPLAPAAIAIALPRGFTTSGVTTWALRLVNTLAAHGRPAALIAHPETSGHARLTLPIHPRVLVRELRNVPDLDAAAGDLSPFLPHYRDVIRELSIETSRPVVLSPNLLGDCYALAAALCCADADRVRVVGYKHLLNPYDTRVLAAYEPIIARFVGVSDHIAGVLRGAVPHRAADVRSIPYGVEVPASVAPRPPLAARPVTLIYHGRIEQNVKRIMALVEMSDELARRGVLHRLTLVGDGPSTREIDARVARTEPGRIRRLEAIAPDGVLRLLEEHDMTVLASRAEGLSVAILEAMSRGCVPVITRTESGATQLVSPGENGELVDLAPDADDATLGRLMADGVQRALSRGLEQLSRACVRRARERFGLEAHARQTAILIDEVADAPARYWPASRPVAFTAGAATSGSGAVPPDGAARLRETLQRLAGRAIVVHGTGRHTIELGGVLADSPARLVAFTDDDPARQGKSLWNWPIVAPADASRTGATDVVISSWINQSAIVERAGVYQRQGLRVHTLYDAPAR